jgi:hypothetical protein
LVVGILIGVALPSGDDETTAAPASPSAPALPEPSETLAPAATGGVPSTGATGAEPTGPVGDVGSSVDNPVPIGSSKAVATWEVEVVGLSPNADAAIHAANQFNEKPPQGSQYVMVTLKNTFVGNGSGDPYSDQTWSLIGGDGTLYEDADFVVLPKDLSNVGKVPAGASGIGNVAFIVPSGQVHNVTLYLEAYTESFDTEGAFFALS